MSVAGWGPPDDDPYESEPPPRSWRWMLAVALFVGLAVGYAVGFAVGDGCPTV